MLNSLFLNWRNNFENFIPPSVWGNDLQDLYIKRLKDIVVEWESSGDISFMKLKTLYLNKGLVDPDFVDDLITELKLSLQSRGLI